MNNKLYLLVSSVFVLMSFFLGKEGCAPGESVSKIDSLVNALDSIKYTKDTVYRIDTFKIEYPKNVYVRDIQYLAKVDTISGDTIYSQVEVYKLDTSTYIQYLERELFGLKLFDTFSVSSNQLKDVKSSYIVDSTKFIVRPTLDIPAIGQILNNPQANNKFLLLPGYNFNYFNNKSSYSLGVGIRLKNDFALMSTINPQNKVIQTNLAIPIFKW